MSDETKKFTITVLCAILSVQKVHVMVAKLVNLQGRVDEHAGKDSKPYMLQPQELSRKVVKIGTWNRQGSAVPAMSFNLSETHPEHIQISKIEIFVKVSSVLSC